MSGRSVALERSDALEQYAYAAVTDDTAGMREALDRLASALPDPGTPSDEVKQALIEADPIAAAAAGWMTYRRLVDVVMADPDSYLDTDEAEAVRAHGDHVLRTLVACRKAGRPFSLTQTGTSAEVKSSYALAARGRVLNAEALATLLHEHGLDTDDDGDGAIE